MPFIQNGKQPFLNVTHDLDLIYIPIKFSEDIPNGKLVMGCTIFFNGKNKHRCVTWTVIMGEQSFLHAKQCLELIHISINVHEDILHSYQAMKLTRILITHKTITNQNTITLEQNIRRKP